MKRVGRRSRSPQLQLAALSPTNPGVDDPPGEGASWRSAALDLTRKEVEDAQSYNTTVGSIIYMPCSLLPREAAEHRDASRVSDEPA